MHFFPEDYHWCNYKVGLSTNTVNWACFKEDVQKTVQMPVSVHLLCPLRGDSRIHSSNRQNLTPETRNPQQPKLEISSSKPRPQSHDPFHDRMVSAMEKAENMLSRLQLLKKRLGCLRSKSSSILHNVFKVPPIRAL